MKRSIIQTLILALAALVIAGCGGGGGNGGNKSPITGTTTLHGQILDSSGSPLAGATVQILASTKSPLSGTTGANGFYTIYNVPVGVDLSISVSGSGITPRTWSGVRIHTSDASGIVKIDINIPLHLPQEGSRISISPKELNKITVGTQPRYTVQVTDAVGNPLYTEYAPVWTVIGINYKLENFGRDLVLFPENANTKARISAAVLIEGNQTITDTLEVEVKKDDDLLFPPPPPDIN